MQTLQELGEAVAERRKALNLRQQVVAEQAGITPESLSRFERGRGAEFGARKLQVRFRTGGEVKIAAFGGKRFRGAPAETPGTARNQRCFSGQLQVHVGISFSGMYFLIWLRPTLSYSTKPPGSTPAKTSGRRH